MSRTTTLDDFEPYEDTEDQFASSVAGHHETEDDDAEQEIVASTLESARARYRYIPVENLPNDLPSSTSSAENEAWKNEVASCLQSYKAKRRKSLGDESLSFNFESTAGNHVFLRPEHEPEPEPEPTPAPVYQEPEPPAPFYAHNVATAPAYEPPTEPMEESTPYAQGNFFEPEMPAPKQAPETAKLIVFPRPPAMREVSRDELAEPVFDRPRILDAPEAVETVAVPLADITLRPEAPDDPCVPYIEPLLELPYRVAPTVQRVSAEAVDTLLVLVASGLFAIILGQMNAQVLMQDKKTMLGLLVVIPAAFWAIYKYVFFVFAGATPGMQMTRMHLVAFDGNFPSKNARRNRALSMLVSIFPFGLGLLWSFVDQERLCWHDRISRTYMTSH
ncbi:MAG TPA: RDD family protein [Terriglobales bacterium]|nr:RDD family protein [Terriglobales bacterium]